MIFLTDLRSRPILLVLLLVVPATVLVYKTALDNRKLQLAESRNRLLGIAQMDARDLQRDIRSALNDGVVLGEMPAVRNFREPDCSALLLRMMAGNSELANVLVLDAQGNVRCNGAPINKAQSNQGEREYFRKAMQSGDPVVGQPIADLAAGKQSLPIAAPIENPDGRIGGMIVIALDLGRHSELLIQSQRLSGITFLLWDDKATLLFRYPDDGQLSRKSLANPALAAAIAGKSIDSAVEAPGFDGILRIFGVAAPLPEYADSGFHIGISVPAKSLYATADALVTRMLWAMGAIALIGLAAAWFIGRQMIWRQVKALANSNTRLELALEGGQLGSWDFDIASDTTTYSRRHAEIFGYTNPPSVWHSHTFLEHVLPEDRPRARECFQSALTSGRCDVDLRIVGADGALRWIAIKGQIQRDAQNRPVHMLGVVADITAQVVAEQNMRRLNRTLHMLSDCNQALVRATSEKELLDTICAHIVDGGYPLAWVGIARHDDAHTVEPVAMAGTEAMCAHARKLRISWANDDIGQGPTGTAIREGQTNVVQDIASEPRYVVWRDEALQLGIASSIALPLKDKQTTFGALNVYAPQKNAFNAQEVDLLEELADDLAYGIASLRNSAMRDRFERELEFQTNFDMVTGLANRALFLDRLEQSLIHAGHTGRHVAVMVINLDRFTGINENLGHESGDLLLTGIGHRLRQELREGDTIARLSSDEFGAAINDLEQPENVVPLAHKILRAIAEPLSLDVRDVFITASIGISIFPRDGGHTEMLLSQANTAMHSAKNEGGNTFRFFSEEMNKGVSFRFALSGALRRALELQELHLHYQPKVSLTSGTVVGAEALARWPHNEMGMISPADFIPLAEETGLIIPLGEWVLDSVCGQMREWRDAGLPALSVSINLSARQFRQENLAESIRRALEHHRLDPGLLELEITESTAMIDVEKAVSTLRELKNIGVRLSIDDFGTGYSSLTYLKRFPLDHLKIDRTFVRDITSDSDDAAICSAIIGLAHTLKMTVIAEGVETREQMDYLRRHFCDEIQGYYFSQPLPAYEFARLLKEGRRLDLAGK